MRKPKDNDFAERRKDAADAKAALLQAHRAAREAAEPTRLARQEERLAAAAAKEEGRAQRAQAEREEQKRVHAEREEQGRVQAEAVQHQAAADAAARAEAEAREKVQNKPASLVVDDEAARKAERDRRYANRKARKR